MHQKCHKNVYISECGYMTEARLNTEKSFCFCFCSHLSDFDTKIIDLPLSRTQTHTHADTQTLLILVKQIVATVRKLTVDVRRGLQKKPLHKTN